MLTKHTSISVLIFAMAVAISSCTSTVPKLNTTIEEVTRDDLKNVYAELAKTGGTLFTLQPKKSIVRIYAFRSGRLAKCGTQPRFFCTTIYRFLLSAF